MYWLGYSSKSTPTSILLQRHCSSAFSVLKLSDSTKWRNECCFSLCMWSTIESKSVVKHWMFELKSEPLVPLKVPFLCFENGLLDLIVLFNRNVCCLVWIKKLANQSSFFPRVLDCVNCSSISYTFLTKSLSWVVYFARNYFFKRRPIHSKHTSCKISSTTSLLVTEAMKKGFVTFTVRRFFRFVFRKVRTLSLTKI